METGLLVETKHPDKFIVTEKEVTYRIARQHYTEQEIQKIDSPERVKDFMAEIFETSPIEVLYALAIDSSNDFLGFAKISQGTVDRAAVYPRGLLSFLLVETNATGVILAHNHPGGTAKPSQKDIALTKRIDNLIKDLDVKLLDHVIYAPGKMGEEPKWVSMRSEGFMD